MINPLISVIMPAYNASKYIGQAIESVLNQSYSKLELVIINDGSQDNTADIIENYRLKDSRIVYLEQKNGKQGKARNNGIRHSEGEIIALHDADDLWDSDLLSKQLEIMNREKVDFVYSNVRVLYEDKPAMEDGLFFDLSVGIAVGRYVGKEFFDLLVKSNRVVTQTAFFKKDIAEKAGLFEEEIEFQNCEDYDLWLKMAFNGCSFFGNIEILGTYRKHAAGSISDIIRQLRPELAVINRLYQQQMISKGQWVKTVTWLTRVMLLNLAMERKWQSIIKILSKKDPIAFIPKGPFFHFVVLCYEYFKFRVKKILRKMVIAR